jgi:predicted Fe-Mo cluster-binding NifX family protein
MKKKIAIPAEKGKLCAHFGHCEKFYIADVENGEITKEEEITPPEHQPGLYPKWLRGLGIECVIAGGMGEKAQKLFQENSIQLYTGVPVKTTKDLTLDYIHGTLKSGVNTCDHHHKKGHEENKMTE